MHASITGDAYMFVYFPSFFGNADPECKLFTGIEITTHQKVNSEEMQLLIKTTVDSFPAIPDNATLLKVEKAIEQIYNGLHGNKALRIDSFKVVQTDPVTEELRHHILTLACPECHRETRAIISWDLVDARSKNLNPIANMFFKKDKTECGHSFIVFVDRAFKVKGYEAVDI